MAEHNGHTETATLLRRFSELALCRARQLLAFVRAVDQPDIDVLAAIGEAVPLPPYSIAAETCRGALSDLVAMGFERCAASAALSACGGDAAEAATSLFDAQQEEQAKSADAPPEGRPPEPAVQEGVPR